MKQINTTPVEQLGGYSYMCECGCTHKVSTRDIIFRDNALSELAPIVEKLAGLGSKVMIIYSAGSEYLKEMIEDNLEDFEVLRRVLEIKLPDESYLNEFMDLPEDVRVIIAVGGGVLCDTVKFIATALNRNYIIIPDVIRCDAFLSPSCVIYKGGFKEVYKVRPPSAVIADYNILLNMSETDVASAFGCIMGKYISLFDWKLSNIICGEKFCTTVYELESSILRECIEAAEGARRREKPSLVKLIELNLRSGAYMQLAGSSRLSCGGETHVEHVLEMLFIREEREMRTYGENIMICTAFLAKVYRIALERDFGNMLFPPDNTLRADCMTEYLGTAADKAVLKVRPILDEKVLKARRHKLKEYRPELLDEIAHIEKDVIKGYKYFRRLYMDAGYSLADYVDSADFKVAMPLAPDVREKFTFLTMLKDMGLLDSYLC